MKEKNKQSRKLNERTNNDILLLMQRKKKEKKNCDKRQAVLRFQEPWAC